MARAYGTIDCELWDEAAFRRLSDQGKIFLCYLRTCKHANAAGCFVAPIAYVAHDLGWDMKRINAAFDEVSLNPYALRDIATETVFIANWWKRSGPANPNVARHVATTLLALPDCSLKAKAIAEFRIHGKYSGVIDQVIGDWTYEPSQDSLPLTPQIPMLEIEASKPEPKERGSRITPDWTPTAEDWTYAHGKLSNKDAEGELIKFVRYFTGPDAKSPVKKDWARTWANWIDKAAESKPKTNGNGHHVNGNGNGSTMYRDSVGDPRWPARVAGYHRSKLWLASWGPEPGQPGCKVPAELLAPVS